MFCSKEDKHHSTNKLYYLSIIENQKDNFFYLTHHHIVCHLQTFSRVLYIFIAVTLKFDCISLT